MTPPVIRHSRWGSEGEAVGEHDQGPAPGPQPVGGNKQWYAVQTRSRHEKLVAARLHRQGIEAYLPVIPEVHHWSDRRKVLEVPLFPGYAFFRSTGSRETTVKVLRSEGVVSIVGVQPQGTPIPDREIGAIRRLIASRISYTNYPFLQIGQRVRIQGGALDGLEGFLLARKHPSTLIVSLEIIQRSLAVPIEGYEVQAA